MAGGRGGLCGDDSRLIIQCGCGQCWWLWLAWYWWRNWAGGRLTDVAGELERLGRTAGVAWASAPVRLWRVARGVATGFSAGSMWQLIHGSGRAMGSCELADMASQHGTAGGVVYYLGGNDFSRKDRIGGRWWASNGQPDQANYGG